MILLYEYTFHKNIIDDILIIYQYINRYINILILVKNLIDYNILVIPSRFLFDFLILQFPFVFLLSKHSTLPSSYFLSLDGRGRGQDKSRPSLPKRRKPTRKLEGSVLQVMSRDYPSRRGLTPTTDIATKSRDQRVMIVDPSRLWYGYGTALGFSSRNVTLDPCSCKLFGEVP